VPEYLVDCDQQITGCQGKVEMVTPIQGLSDEQLNHISKYGKACLTRDQLRQYGYMVDPLAEAILSGDTGDRCIEVNIRAGSCDACRPSNEPHNPYGGMFLNSL